MRTCLSCLLLALAGCASAPATSGDIQFDETTNLGFLCSSQALSRWTVSCVETQELGAASCEQPVLFASYRGGETFTFDIKGYTPDGTPDGRLCWVGSCARKAVGGQTVYADCSAQIQPLSGCP